MNFGEREKGKKRLLLDLQKEKKNNNPIKNRETKDKNFKFVLQTAKTLEGENYRETMTIDESARKKNMILISRFKPLIHA